MAPKIQRVPQKFSARVSQKSTCPRGVPSASNNPNLPHTSKYKILCMWCAFNLIIFLSVNGWVCKNGLIINIVYCFIFPILLTLTPVQCQHKFIRKISKLQTWIPELKTNLRRSGKSERFSNWYHMSISKALYYQYENQNERI